jgi:cytochrome c-type biogenesis protein CcmH/NrfF
MTWLADNLWAIPLSLIVAAWLFAEAICARALRRNERMRRDDQHEHVPGGWQ